MQVNTPFSRTFQLTDDDGNATDVVVRIGIPTQRSEAEWSCTYTIEGFRRPYTSRPVPQVDALGSFLAALQRAGVHLSCSAEPEGGRLTWEGRADLGLPVLSPEPRYDVVFTPSDGGPPRKLEVKVHHPERVDGGWRVLVDLMDCDTYKTIERIEKAETWPKALERGAAAVPDLLAAYVDAHGGGALEDAPGPS
jgi:hypothetical protein